MPNRGIDIIDGIPVFLKGSDMFAFQYEASLQPQTHTQAHTQGPMIKLGTYDTVKKVATWFSPDTRAQWLEDFRTNMTGRMRK